MPPEYRTAQIQRLYSALQAVQESITLAESQLESAELPYYSVGHWQSTRDHYVARRVSIIRRLQARGENVES